MLLTVPLVCRPAPHEAATAVQQMSALGAPATTLTHASGAQAAAPSPYTGQVPSLPILLSTGQAQALPALNRGRNQYCNTGDYF